MKNNPIKKLLFIFTLAGIFFSASCNKQFEEDPKSVRWIRFKKRFIGEWELSKLTIDGNDVSSLMYIDSLKIYKYWHIKDYVRKNSSSNATFELKTHNGKFIMDNSKYVVLNIVWTNRGNEVTDPETKEVSLYFAKLDYYGNCCRPIDSTLVSGHTFSNVHMKIIKLTKEEMHLQTKKYDYAILNYHYYDMYFEKKGQ